MKRILARMTPQTAGSDLLKHALLETVGSREEPDYDTPESLGRGFDVKT